MNIIINKAHIYIKMLDFNHLNIQDNKCNYLWINFIIF